MGDSKNPAEVATPLSQAAYPFHREADVVLRDGSTVRIRPVRPEDEPGLFSFLRSLSPTSRALRYFIPVQEPFLAAAARRDTHVDYASVFGLVALVGPEERIVAHALYAAIADSRAEAAFTVADDYQGKGLGTLLLGQIAEAAAANGIYTLEAEVLPENGPMIEVFRESGFPMEIRSEAPGEVRACFPTSLTSEALAQFDAREQVACAAAMKSFLEPKSVAVIGASRQRGTIGGEIFHNLLEYGFSGAVTPVNATAGVVQSVRAYPDVEAIPDEVDLAVIAVPSAAVLESARQCVRKGVRALVVISAGFAETGEAGRERQAELVRICRSAGVRIVGPNCMGVLNTDPAVRLHATFAPVAPQEGRVAFSSQSGALGLAVIDQANRLRLGISSFVSMGNKADISGNDLLCHWETDPRTDVILLYLESFGNPRKFSRVARRVARKKPVVVVKSGRSKAGARATSSHTGALLASSDVTVDALFRQAGVIRTDTLEDLFDVASLLAHQPLPLGRGVGIVTNAGGPGILCADACEAEGLEVPLLAAETQARLRSFLPPEASVTNPVDMVAAATGEHYRKAISAVAADPGVKAIVAIFIPPLATRAEEVARGIVDAGVELGRSKPLLSVFMSARGIPQALQSQRVEIPSYAFPEAAARALARAARYGEWKQRPWAPAARPAGVHREDAARIVRSALVRGTGWLPPNEVSRLLACYGLPVVEQYRADDPKEAGAAADRLGGSVVLKVLAQDLLHKSDAGAVRLSLTGTSAVEEAARELEERVRSLGHRPDGFLVQRMAGAGVEMIVGVVHDPHFGPVLACGAGGILVEILGDVSVRLTPLGETDASEMIRGLKSYRLLTGFRGKPAVDVRALEDAVVRIATLVEDLREVVELDVNPIIVHEVGATIVDARVRLGIPMPSRPLGARS